MIPRTMGPFPADLPAPPRPGSTRVLGGATLVVGVAIAIGVFLELGVVGVYDLGYVLRTLPHAAGPARLSLLLTTISFGIGFFLALPVALIRASGPFRAPRGSAPRNRRWPSGWGWLSLPAYGLATAYVAAVRGTPALVQVFLVYFAVIFTAPRFELFGQPAAIWAGLLALVINTTGYQAEALRGGFQSVDPGQIEAARALGLGRLGIFLRVSLPQCLRLVTLPLANEWISNFKTSTVLSYITIFELYSWAHADIAYEAGRPVEAFVLLAIVYLLVNVTLSRAVTYLEHRRRIPGLGSLDPSIVPRAG